MKRQVLFVVIIMITQACLAFAQGSESSTSLTESQKILWKVMEDIRHCDKSVRYEYDSKTRTISPPELSKLKGFKFKKVYHDIAVFEINEEYLGMHAAVLVVGRAPTLSLPLCSVAFKWNFPGVRHRLEREWGIKFQDDLRPGPDLIEDASYANLYMFSDGKERVLSIEEMPPGLYPYIALPEVGCNQFDN